jgi:hypothetical protein
MSAGRRGGVLQRAPRGRRRMQSGRLFIADEEIARTVTIVWRVGSSECAPADRTPRSVATPAHWMGDRGRPTRRREQSCALTDGDRGRDGAHCAGGFWLRGRRGARVVCGSSNPVAGSPPRLLAGAEQYELEARDALHRGCFCDLAAHAEVPAGAAGDCEGVVVAGEVDWAGG